MTINESAAPGNGRGSQSSPRPAPNGSKPQAPSRAPLIDRLLAGEPYAIAFGGQGSSWLDALEEITRDSGIEPEITDLVNEATRLVAPVADELLVVRPLGFDPIGWMLERDLAEEGEGNPGPSDTVLTSAPVSPPGIFLCQLAALRALTLQGIDPAVTRPVVSVGHSQGLLGVYSVGDDAARDAELLAIAQLSGAAAALVGRRRGLIGSSPRSPMMSVANVDPDELRAVVAEVAHGVDPKIAPFVSIRNGRRRVVVSGAPAQLERLRDRCKEITAEQTKERDAKKRGGAVFAPVFEPIAVGLAFHHPTIEECVDIAGDWAAKCGIDVERTREIASRCLFEPVDWVVETDKIIESGARWVLDLGPGDLLTRMTSAALRGTDIGVIPVATRGGQRNLLTPGATPEVRAAWSTFAPKPVTLPDGRVVVETAFTKLTGRSPILLAGMTPTTVDAKIVAAAANAGHWAELAGGGQVTEPIFLDRVAELRTLLEPGRAVQFNSLFLDPYLWKLQLGGRRLVQRSRAAGAPFDGVVVTAGIPELEEAVALIEELTEAGIAHIAFKPGTVAQIRSVVRIANEVPNVPVIMHIEGGRAGGHHSWEDLDDLLIETYAELRTRPNLVVCVGGGIGTPERAADYLTGRWSTAHGYPEMPLDGILVGTAAMAALEATTSPQVKQLLVDTPGTPDWVGAGTAEGGMASGRSQLGADIHEIDNAASRTGRLLDEVAGDAEAVAKRRDEIIAALDVTAKPYFGDIATMTYGQWLQRYVELAVGLDPHQDFDCGSDLGDVLNAATESPWLDRTWRDRFADMLQRAEARLHPVDRGPIPTLFSDPESLERPVAALCALKARYPETDTAILHPADVSFFVSLCKTPGKPVNFVPVVDGDVRRWWRSDSLWQAHDPRYTADQVCVIPGTVAVAGITRVDEPVGDLLNRFEKATTDALLAAGVAPTKVASRRDAGVAVGPVDIVLAAPDVTWSSRLTRNPVGRLGDVSEWTVDAAGTGATHQRTGASLVEIDSQNVQLEVPLNKAGASVKIRIAVPSSTHDGGAPVVSDADAESSMSALLAVAAAGELPEVKVTAGKPVAHLNLAWSPDLVADHGGVTSSGLPEKLDTVGTTVPDVVVGACWPAVFAVLGATRTAEGTSVIEGMLDLVHLDHQVNLVRELPSDTSIFAVRAESTSVLDTDLGRVVEVHVEIGVMRDHGLATPTVATLVERFAIRGRSGTGELTDPPRAGGALGADAADTPRKRRRDTTIEAPRNMAAFAKVSGDHNPIHTSGAAALLAGLGSPIVHGMWLSAAAQQVVSAADAAAGVPARRLTAWTTRFLGMVRPGAKIDVRVDRIAIDAGAEVVEVSCRVEGDLVMVATGRLAVPKTIYAFPGQGIQRPGMGLDARTRSKAAKAIWDRADKHTRKALGFSILAVVRDNPTYIKARGVEHRHPAGVLHLTQFTQVAMATLGVAQIAELRESGAFVEGALLAGHSVGEYNALAAAAGVLPLEAVLEVVFQRGSAMHALVPRDDKGNSNYRMAAIRPSQIGLADADVQSFIAEIASRTGEFLEVVNLNLRGSQYAIAGTVEGLAELETEIDERRAQTGGKRAFILVPGIDVPFHSTVLRDGVPEFRHKLEALLPADLHPEILVGRYIPNLVPKPFSLERDFVQEIADLVPSEPLDEVLADFDDWAARPADLCRVVLIELLAWQFASPVRWIETQDLLFTDEAHGGLGVERFIEVGLASAPTVAGLATNTLKLPGRIGGPVEVLNIERDAAVVYATDVDAAPAEEDDAPVAAAPEAAAAAAPAAPAAAPAAPSGGPRPDDIVFSAADATKVLIALWTKLRLDQIGPVDTIEALCDGVSSRRNQLLVDLGSELSLGAIDGAADADMAALSGTVEKLARTYKPFGSVLSDSIGDHLRKVFGPSGRRPAAITDRVKKVWELGDGWANHVMAEVSLGTRDGASVRGGSLGGLADGALADAAAVDKVIDAAVAAVASRRGISVALPSTGGGGGGTVDAAALGEFTENITGRNGVLASAARLVLEQLGLTDEVTVAALSTETDLVDLVSAELGSDWPRLVAPSFDGKRAVLLDDRWATAREDLARLWIGDDSISSITADTFVGAGKAVAAQALWWQQRATAADKVVLAAAYGQIADAAVRTEIGEYSSDVAVVTGGSKGSIAAAVAGKLLGGGATVVVTTSRLDDERLGFYRELYRNNARAGAALWVVPANMASYADVDALIDWVGSEQVDTAGGAKKVTKSAMTPTLLFPFAAPRVAGDLADAGARAEMEMRVLLWSVERLIGGLGKIGYDHDVDSRLHVVLPGSPNRGLFGGDGAYGESKAALDAVVARWSAERSWAERVTIAHALIGWVRGTGLMGHNDPLVDAVEEAGVRTWSTLDMASALLELCTPEARLAAADKPNQVDLTGGLAEANLDLPALAKRAAEAPSVTLTEADEEILATISALAAPPSVATVLAPPAWSEVTADPADLVVIVGVGEVGPYGSARTRFEMEVDEQLSAAGVLELAWTTGLVTWENDPKPGWYDAESGDLVAEADIADKYHDTVVARCGIRRYEDDGSMVDNHAPLLTSVFLDDDLKFVVTNETEARSYYSADPEHTVIAPVADSTDWQVTRRAGTEIRVPRKMKLTRTVGGQIPTGFDPTKWGISADMASSIDRVALWNIVSTVDAFISSGFTPSELMRWVHPSLVANTQGSGMGGMSSIRSMYVDTLLGEAHANDILQEALGNVVAAHVVQSYVGSYGAMVHPVAACATAAVSVEEGVDKIKLGKADFVVAGGFDDLSTEAIIGFADMSATADADVMHAKGISDRRFSRANDRRRGGFVESNGGGTVLLARGDVALEMGLPVLGVVAFAQSFGDGVHTSIPAPGLGALGAGRGGRESKLAAALNALGVTADDIAVVSKHDTSTNANDPNEAELHERLAAAIGRSEGAPLFVVSQKSLTGHAKGGAAAFQINGLCQVLSQGVVPPNRSLDCVDDKMAEFGHLVWARQPLRFGESYGLKAGLVTSLGFGHVSGLVAIVHPEAFVQSIAPARRADYVLRAGERAANGRQKLAQSMCGGDNLYQRPADRRLGGDDVAAGKIRQLEADMLLSETARLGNDGVYNAGTGCA